MAMTPYRPINKPSKWGNVARAVGQGIAAVAEINYREKMELERQANLERIRQENMAREDKQRQEDLDFRQSESDKNAAHRQQIIDLEKAKIGDNSNKSLVMAYQSRNVQKGKLHEQIKKLSEKYDAGELELTEAQYNQRIESLIDEINTYDKLNLEAEQRHPYLKDHRTDLFGIAQPKSLLAKTDKTNEKAISSNVDKTKGIAAPKEKTELEKAGIKVRKTPIQKMVDNVNEFLDKRQESKRPGYIRHLKNAIDILNRKGELPEEGWELLADSNMDESMLIEAGATPELLAKIKRYKNLNKG